MFQMDWAVENVWAQETKVSSTTPSKLNTNDVRKTALVHWEEHCLECALPGCYSSCALYSRRADGKCSRFEYGIFPNPGFSGLFAFGADVRFRRWGKLETRLYGKTVSVAQHHLFDRMNRSLSRPLKGRRGARISTAARTLLGRVRNKYFTRIIPAPDNPPFDAFVIECFSPENDSYRIMLEHFDRETRSRHSFTIEPGWNFFTVPAESLEFASNPPSGKITLFPENNVEKRVIFTWLDLVSYRNVPTPASASARSAPAAKVKCVAWDLDNTMWKGVVAENSITQLQPRTEAVELVRQLDERGIIQTVVSKNNFADAWRVIESLRLEDYFLHPAINWQPKSSNLSNIASRLNINIDTFALIDDSPFERAEVQAAFPQVRVYSDDRIKTILSLPEFDVPVTEASRKRRVSYLTEIRREEEREAAGGDYEAFLRSCRMKLRLFVPRDPAQVLRCLELIQRANQLNMSNTRYSADEFERLLSRPGFLCLALQCEDRFGEYGIVGFASVDESCETPTLRDFVLSCRVAQKKVEHAFVEWLAVREQAVGKRELRAAIVRTERNRQILQVFRELQFLPIDKSEEAAQIIMLSLHDLVSAGGPVTVEAEGDLFIAGASMELSEPG